MAQWLRSLGVSAGTCALALTGVWVTWAIAVPYITDHDYFRLRAIRISCDETRVPAQALAEIAGLYEGSSLWDVDPSAIQGTLSEASWIKQSSVSRHFPWQVSLNVARRHGVAAAVASGKAYLVDREGALFHEIEETSAPDLPYLTGWDEVPSTAERGARLRSLLAVLGAAEERKLEVSELHMDEDGTVWLYATKVKAAVRVGAPTRAEQALERLEIALAELGPLADRARLIDTDYRDRIVIRGADDKLPAMLAAHSEKALAPATGQPVLAPGDVPSKASAKTTDHRGLKATPHA